MCVIHLHHHDLLSDAPRKRWNGIFAVMHVTGPHLRVHHHTAKSCTNLLILSTLRAFENSIELINFSHWHSLRQKFDSYLLRNYFLSYKSNYHHCVPRILPFNSVPSLLRKDHVSKVYFNSALRSYVTKAVAYLWVLRQSYTDVLMRATCHIHFIFV